MKLAIDVIGDTKVLGDIAEMRARAMDAKPATRKVRDLLLASNAKQFQSSGSGLGKPWAPLTPATLERKSREGLDLRPMHGKTGALKTSLEGGKGKRTGATKSTARAGSGVWYSIFARGTKGSIYSHNTGEVTRKLIGFTTAECEEIMQIVSSYIVHGIVP